MISPSAGGHRTWRPAGRIGSKKLGHGLDAEWANRSAVFGPIEGAFSSSSATAPGKSPADSTTGHAAGVGLKTGVAAGTARSGVPAAGTDDEAPEPMRLSEVGLRQPPCRGLRFRLDCGRREPEPQPGLQKQPVLVPLDRSRAAAIGRGVTNGVAGHSSHRCRVCGRLGHRGRRRHFRPAAAATMSAVVQAGSRPPPHRRRLGDDGRSPLTLPCRRSARAACSQCRRLPAPAPRRGADRAPSVVGRQVLLDPAGRLQFVVHGLDLAAVGGVGELAGHPFQRDLQRRPSPCRRSGSRPAASPRPRRTRGRGSAP